MAARAAMAAMTGPVARPPRRVRRQAKVVKAAEVRPRTVRVEVLHRRRGRRHRPPRRRHRPQVPAAACAGKTPANSLHHNAAARAVRCA